MSIENSLNCCEVHENVVQKFKLKWQEMTGETRISLADVGRKRQTDGTDCTSSGRVFQKVKATTGNE